ncbi:hypothetical protein DL96DRAFT_649695 [Flagelloscypha sp. PMI_526]|nr:hypothetical protein DL96DRAFT_649695 [Flagelloscypha sp. PMI_526]
MASAVTLPSLITKLTSILPTSLPKAASYIIPASTLTASGQPQLLGPLFTHITRGMTEKEALPISIQLRDILLKQWTLIGIPLVISAVPGLAKAEKEAGFEFPDVIDNKYLDPSSNLTASPSTPAEKIVSDPLSARGEKFMLTLYQSNLSKIFSTWGSHQSTFVWLEKQIIYGQFLSDHTILSPIEAELVILSTIIVGQPDLKGPSLWHIRGLLRMGVEKEDVKKVVAAVEEVFVWAKGGKESERRGWVDWVDEVNPEDQDSST